MAALNFVHPDGENLPAGTIRVLGIDLGTTNSTVAEIIWDPESGEQPVARCLTIPQKTGSGQYSHHLVPSVVANADGECLVGEGAKRMIGPSRSLYRDIFYDCKNDMGLRRTYHRASEGYRSAKEIAGMVLGFLRDAAHDGNLEPSRRVTITVPASFQMAQRNDTLDAANMARIEVSGGDLLDEPVAALIDYWMTHEDAITKPGNMVVFDFGGGTCDIAIFRIDPEGPEISELSVSRYHRLGGTDITKAIVHKVLVPQLVKQNSAESNDLSFEDRKIKIEPALLSVAEALKVQLCDEIRRLQRTKQYESRDKKTIARSQPGAHLRFELSESGELSLANYTLNAAEFETLLDPFLDPDQMQAEETEYQLTCSIFAPIQDALDRAGIYEDEVDYCLLVGGSALIPQMQSAIEQFMPTAKILMHRNHEDTQVAIARGAAYNALSMALCHRPLIRPVAPDDISIRTSRYPVRLVPRGSGLPFPADGWEEVTSLAVPRHAGNNIADPTEMRVEIISGDGDNTEVVYSQIWEIPPMVDAGASLRLQFRLDENKALHLNLSLADGATPFGPSSFSSVIQNPLSNVVNPNATRDKIDRMEEELRSMQANSESIPAESLVELAKKYSSLGQTDKAIAYQESAIKVEGRNATMLNQLGIYYRDKGDLERAREAYRISAEISPILASPMFNLALLEMDADRLSEAKEAVDALLQRRASGPDYILASQIYQELNLNEQAQSALSKSLVLFDVVAQMSDWELHWCRRAAVMANNEDLERECATESRRRNRGEIQTPPPEPPPIIRRSISMNKLLAQFITNREERERFLEREMVSVTENEKPLAYLADTLNDEMNRMIRELRGRLLIDRRVAVLLPLPGQVGPVTERLREAGIAVDVQDTSAMDNGIPKLLTYSQATGHIFDAVFLPRLTESSFRRRSTEEIYQTLFDAISGATKWAYLSFTTGNFVSELSVALPPLLTSGDLAIQRAGFSAPTADDEPKGADNDLDLLL